jgi:hypothetical protein
MMMFFLFRAFLVERIDRSVNYLMELRRVRTNAERIETSWRTRRRRRRRGASGPFGVAAGAGHPHRDDATSGSATATTARGSCRARAFVIEPAIGRDHRPSGSGEDDAAPHPDRPARADRGESPRQRSAT